MLAGDVATILFALKQLAAADTNVIAGRNRKRVHHILLACVVMREDLAYHTKQTAPQLFWQSVQAATKAAGAQVMCEVTVRMQKATR